MKRNRFLRDWKLIKQIGILFFAFMLVASIVNAALVYRNSMEMLLKEKQETFSNLAEYLATSIQNDKNIEWLFSYWTEHSEEMDIIYDDPVAVERGYKELLSRNPDVVPYLLDTETIKTFSAEDKKLYAEVRYMEWIGVFNDLQRFYKPLFISSFLIKDDGKLFFILNANAYGGKRGNGSDEIYMLGSSHYSSTVRPVRKKTWATGKIFYELEQTPDTYHYHVYAPVNAGGKTLCLIDITLETKTVHKELLSKIARIEIFSIIGFLLSAIALFVLLRAVVIIPITSLQSVMNQYQIDKNYKNAAGRLKEYFGQNEMGLLSFDFSSLVMEIHDYTENIKKLVAEEERIGTELSIATKIQASILPQKFPAFPDRKEFDVYATMTPAKEVGGDFYDFFMVDDDHIALVIADVSGKGVPAALFMMVSKTVIKAQVLAGSGAAETLRIVNNTLSQNNAAEMFVSVWLGIYEISTGTMRCANAGHEYPAIKKAGGNFELFKDKHGFVLGGMAGMKYTEYELNLGAGDVAFVYTDGVPEATDSNGELFGTDRMIDALNSGKDDNLEIILDNVRNHVDEFVGEAEQFDDLTMLVFKVNGSDGGGMKEITLDAKTENIERVTDFVNAELEAVECSMKAQAQIDVAIDEIFSNIARYAYNAAADNVAKTATIQIETTQNSITLKFIDGGVPFNPLEKADPDTTLSADEREIGGLGILMVKKSMDSVEYENKDGKNILTIKKNLQ